MLYILLYQLFVVIFIAFDILILSRLFPVKHSQRKKPKIKKA